MKKVALFVSILVFGFAATLQAAPSDVNGGDGVKVEKMHRFAQSTREALASGHAGLQQGALRMIIQYGDQVNFDASVYDVMRIYRDSDDVRMRQMAVVALGKMETHLAVNYLKRAVQFEKLACVRNTIVAVIAEHEAKA